jgi:hypothetical protein
MDLGAAAARSGQSGAYWCIVVYPLYMAVTKKRSSRNDGSVRRSVSIRPEIHGRIEDLAREQKRSTNQIIENLLTAGLDAKEQEKRRFFEVAERFRTATSPSDVKQAKEELARMIFGS